MQTVSSTIGDFVRGIDVASYFEERLTPDAMRTELVDIRNGISTVEGFAGESVVRDVTQALDATAEALEALALYANEPNAEARQALADTAIARSDAALSGVSTGDPELDMDGLIAVMQAGKGGLSAVSLAYGFGALHYVTLVRQFVADMVQDGPVGAPGLYEALTASALLLYDAADGQGLYGAMLARVAEDIAVVDVQGTDADAEVSFTIISAIGELGIPVTVPRLSGESDADFKERIEGLTAQGAEVLFQAEQEQFGADAIQAIGQAQNAFLAERVSDVAGLHERIGGDENNSETGTALADYFSGLGGDDALNGAGGPDALSGGAGNDILRGGALQDMLVGGAGNDLIFGGDARSLATVAPDGDTARFAGLASEHVILGGTSYAVVTGPDGSRDKLFDVSYLRFDDVEIALQAGSALDTGEVPFETLNKTNFDIGERVALLYEAALNRNGNIDLPGLNFYIDVTARDGLSDEFLAADLMTSQEFTDNFGDANTLSNDAFLEQIYLNVLDRASDAAGRQFYLDLLNDGSITKALALADIAVSPENTQGSAEILMSLYETTTPGVDAGSGITIDWSFVS